MLKIKELIEFEKEMADLFENAKIKFPIHLSGCRNGKQERALRKIFKNIKKDDWILSTWRNHYHWLLSGRSPEKLKRQIIDTGSMHVYDEKFFTSAIVGGIAPIALGLAYALKKKKSKRHVWCFIGCMASKSGIVHECIQYASGHDLPVTYVTEDNDLSVITSTSDSWGTMKKKRKVVRYKYSRKYPHQGTGKFVLF